MFINFYSAHFKKRFVLLSNTFKFTEKKCTVNLSSMFAVNISHILLTFLSPSPYLSIIFFWNIWEKVEDIRILDSKILWCVFTTTNDIKSRTFNTDRTLSSTINIQILPIVLNNALYANFFLVQDPIQDCLFIFSLITYVTSGTVWKYRGWNNEGENTQPLSSGC